MQWDPQSVLAAAVRSAIGWGCVILATTFAGAWLGICVNRGGPPGLSSAFAAVLWIVLSFLFVGRSAIAIAVAGFAWYLPFRYESDLTGIVGAITNFAVWLLIAADLTEEFGVL